MVDAGFDRVFMLVRAALEVFRRNAHALFGKKDANPPRIRRAAAVVKFHGICCSVARQTARRPILRRPVANRSCAAREGQGVTADAAPARPPGARRWMPTRRGL